MDISKILHRYLSAQFNSKLAQQPPQPSGRPFFGLGRCVSRIFDKTAPICPFTFQKLYNMCLAVPNSSRERIEKQFPTCEVVQPPDAWSAVVHGALLRTMVKTRKIRAHYGVVFREVWDPEKHEGDGPLAAFARSHRQWDAFEGVYKCGNRMSWYVKKGEEFDNTKTVAFPFYRNFGLHNSLKNVQIELWAYVDGDEGAEGPPFKDLDCRMLAILRLDFSAINKSEFPKLRSPAGEKYFRINFNLVMAFGTMIAFKLEYKGQVRGDVTAEYIEAMPMQADSCP